ncbi:MAG: heat-inducible transcription repressor HrcA [Ruminococcaceae bacterium]|nr:heat-inducible transcription repressor HrcA [Oscillospiraceae bacterium]
MKLSARKEKILATVVEHYIPTGEPVGSKALSEELGYSSATIRNEMSELCELGYLEKNHASSGRIPTTAGYRYYIDNLMNTSPLEDIECAKLEAMLRSGAKTPEKILENAGGILARLTNCATLITTPDASSATISKVELIPASSKTAILVLLTSSGIIKNCVCRIDIDISESLKERFKQIVDTYFVSANVGALSEEMLADIIDALGTEDYAIKPLLSALYELGREAGESKTFVEGESNLLAYRDTYGDISELISFLQQQEQLSRLVSFSQTKDNSRMSILIGSENVFDELGDSSMILSRYAFGNNAMGTIGIIGPTRIDYARLIPDVQYLTDMVGRLLSEHLGDEEE